MSNIKHIIRLTKKVRDELQKLVEDPETPSREALRANILLDSHTRKNGHPKTIEEIIEKLKTNKMTINRVRASYLENGLEVAIHGKKRMTPPVPAKVNREVEKKIIRIFKSVPPQGKRKWSLSMIANRAIEDGVVDSISTTRVQQILKKYGYSSRLKKKVIPRRRTL